MNLIEIADVTKTFGEVTAVDRLSLDVPEGSIYGFIGPNGSGKTTTLRMIMSIFYPDSGSIRIFGEPAGQSCSERIGYLPEERGLYHNMKVREQLCFLGKLKSGRNVEDAVDRWLERLDMTDWADRKIENLSKGMSQKVQFVAAVVTDPQLVILDEPFTGLDPVNVESIREAVLEMRHQGATVIFSTHDMSMAERMCDYIFMIFKGQKVLDGTLADIQDQYGHDTLRIRCDNGHDVLGQIAGVSSVNDFGQMQELRLERTTDPQQVLKEVMTRTRVTSFEVAKPSLHDIFVRIARPAREEVDHA